MLRIQMNRKNDIRAIGVRHVHHEDKTPGNRIRSEYSNRVSQR